MFWRWQQITNWCQTKSFFFNLTKMGGWCFSLKCIVIRRYNWQWPSPDYLLLSISILLRKRWQIRKFGIWQITFIWAAARWEKCGFRLGSRWASSIPAMQWILCSWKTLLVALVFLIHANHISKKGRLQWCFILGGAVEYGRGVKWVKIFVEDMIWGPAEGRIMFCCLLEAVCALAVPRLTSQVGWGTWTLVSN